jgi:F-type H+-transporting ATPase subunit gamma
VAIVLITSNRGLCGAFNTNAIKMALSIANGKYSRQMQTGNVKFITIGKKGADNLRNRKIPVLNSFNEVLDKPGFEKIIGVAEYLTNLYVTNQVDKIVLVYNKFKNAGVQILTEEQFLPLKKETADKEILGIRPNFEFEPTQDFILKELIPKTLKIELYKAVLDSNASEHGARMTAMHKATDNASDLIKQLTLNYNKARQATITGEILEIVGGAEALKG